jgi:beta-galactosidase GanA
MPKLDFFPIGSSYYPPFHTRDDWARDVRRMAEVGLNAIRTAELIASWDWIEPSRGHFDFSWLDEIFALSAQHDLRILLGTGAGSPPVWLLDEYPDAQVVSHEGVPYPTGARWGWACIDNPGFRQESERYLRVLLERYGGHPALLGWQIHNEIGYPSRPPDQKLYCYCPHTVSRFRQWLRQKYDDLEALSEAWACTPTRHRYSRWEEVQPPRVAPARFGSLGSPGAWLDWRTFINENFAGFVAWQSGIIKEVDEEHPVTTNLVRTTDVVFGVDPWLYPETVDALGYDLYPVDRVQDAPYFISLSLDYARAPALHAGQPFWLPEMESGPIGDWVLGPKHATTASDIRRYSLEAIGHGAKMILYQGYREWDPLPMHWGALVDLEGEPTERYDAARQINEMVEEHEALFLEAQPVRAQVALLWDQANANVAYGMAADEFLLDAVRGLYHAFWSEGYPVEFVTPDRLTQSTADPYQLLLMPFQMLVTAETGKALKDFVSGGGTLVSFAKCAMLDGRSWYWHQRPGAGLSELFGVRERLVQQSDAVALSLEPATELFEGVDATLPGHWHRQDFDLAHDVEVLARYSDGEPAATLKRHGGGRAIAFGTHADVAAHASPAAGYGRLYANLAKIAGVERPVAIGGAPDLDGHLLERGNQRLLVLANHGADAASATVTIPSAAPGAAVEDLLAHRMIQARADAAALHFEVTVAPYDATALLIE